MDSCTWSPLLDGTDRHLALHGTRNRWLYDAREHGLHRASAAWFELDTGRAGATCRRMADTLALAVEFGLGRRLRQADPVDWPAGLTDDEAPAVAVFAVEGPPTGSDRQYRLPATGRYSAPYAKVERAGHGIAPEALVAVATMTAAEIRTAARTPVPVCPVHRGARPAGPIADLRPIDRVPPRTVSWATLQAIGAFLGRRLTTAVEAVTTTTNGVAR